MYWTLAICVLILLALHGWGGRLVFLRYIPRSPALSVAGGVATAYVFGHILPELRRLSETIRQSLGEHLPFLDHHSYLVAMLGFILFYGIEKAAVFSRDRQRQVGGGEEVEPEQTVFWLHTISFAVYNALIGYLLLHLEEQTTVNMYLFTIAIGLHLLVNDFSLCNHYRKRYERVGRWVLIAGLLVGVAVSLLLDLPERFISPIYAFLAGGIILNSIKEEIPEQNRSRFWAFAAGAIGYMLILIVAL